MIPGDIRMFLPINHTFMAKYIELITYQWFSKWIYAVVRCVNITNLYHIIDYKFYYEMIVQCNSFIIQWNHRVLRIEYHTNVVKSMDDGLVKFTPIYWRWYLNTNESSANVSNADNYPPQ